MSLSAYVPTDPEELLSGEDLLRAISVPLSVRDRPLRTERINVSQVAGKMHCYPGEQVAFYTRLQMREAITGFKLEIRIPGALRVEDAYCLSNHVVQYPNILPMGRDSHVIWQVNGEIGAQSEFEFCVETRIAATAGEFVAVSRAVVMASSQANGDELHDEEEVAVTVTTRATYLNYLPAVYAQDRLMSRFLMLFESFWAPIDLQIDGIDHYFDPTLTPKDFLPWLSAWIALPVSEDEQTITGSGVTEAVHPDEVAPSQPLLAAAQTGSAADVLPASRADDATAALISRSGELDGAADGGHDDAGSLLRVAREPLILPSSAQNARNLLKVTHQLHKKRGTRRGLQQYLEIYTEAEVHVIEHRAANFVLAECHHLGRRIALGRDNHPHTFTVILRFPVARLKLAQMGDELVAARLAHIRRRVIPIIEEQRPAHTSYTLQIEVVPT